MQINNEQADLQGAHKQEREEGSPCEPVKEDRQGAINHNDAEEVDPQEANKQETETQQLPRCSERNRMPPFRDGVITGDWWKQDVTCG